ncbi:kinase-like domain-containing protein [Rhizophagus irregularis DAOM 181602=DAOM 197198]|nr:kinase-like domain-containing protein [Rhizophagus irregularis DAOM 181602=DAOM 197198]
MQQWNRQSDYEVILKIPIGSSSFDEFLSEWKYNYNLMSYAKEGSLRKCLSSIVKLKWQYKLQLLKNIILGLKIIHESNLVHCDLHDSNILMSDNYETYIIDLGLCRPVNDSSQDKTDENYGILPYMAPEILRNDPYIPASDIYSFSMIMWEFTSGVPPFNNKAYDYQLTINICEGDRPEVIKNTPKCYIDLMKKCWDSDPSKRPTIGDLEHIISQWLKCVNRYYEINEGNSNDMKPLYSSDIIQFKVDIDEFIRANEASLQEQPDTSIVQSHPQSYYTSRLHTEILVQNSDCLDCMVDD